MNAGYFMLGFTLLVFGSILVYMVVTYFKARYTRSDINRVRCHKLWLKRWNKAWKRACSRAYFTYKEDIEMCNPWMFFWEELEDLKKKHCI